MQCFEEFKYEKTLRQPGVATRELGMSGTPPATDFLVSLFGFLQLCPDGRNLEDLTFFLFQLSGVDLRMHP